MVEPEASVRRCLQNSCPWKFGKFLGTPIFQSPLKIKQRL